MNQAIGSFVDEILKQDYCPLVPSEDRVVLRMEERQGMSGALYIPDSAKDAPQFATILAIGFNASTTDEYVVGDRVLFGKYTGNICTIDKKEYLVLRIEDILAKVKR